MKRILLTQGQFAVVDAINYEWLSQHKWCAWWNKGTQSYYAVRGNSKDGKKYMIYMHREILGLVKGDKRYSDHINHRTLDNRESNLRIVTHQQNHFNQKNPKGYTWHKHAKKYMSQICMNGKMINLGYFNNAKEAHVAYLEAKKKYHKI